MSPARVASDDQRTAALVCAAFAVYGIVVGAFAMAPALGDSDPSRGGYFIQFLIAAVIMISPSAVYLVCAFKIRSGSRIAAIVTLVLAGSHAILGPLIIGWSLYNLAVHPAALTPGVALDDHQTITSLIPEAIRTVFAWVLIRSLIRILRSP